MYMADLFTYSATFTGAGYVYSNLNFGSPKIELQLTGSPIYLSFRSVKYCCPTDLRWLVPPYVVYLLR